MLCLTGLTFLSLSCKGPEGPAGPEGPQGPAGSPGTSGTSDKQIRFIFNVGEGTSDTTWQMCPPYEYITPFNISNYDSLDSVILGAYMGTANPGAECIADLFDVTDSVEIAESPLVSTVSGSEFGWPWVYSGNLLNSFPGKDITLAVRVRTNQQGDLAQVNGAVLLLYRK